MLDDPLCLGQFTPPTLDLRVSTDALIFPILVMSIHRLGADPEYGTLLHPIPVMEHIGVLQRALSLLCRAGNYFCLVAGNDLLETGLAML
jgi:hypothetical protein